MKNVMFLRKNTLYEISDMEKKIVRRRLLKFKESKYESIKCS